MTTESGKAAGGRAVASYTHSKAIRALEERSGEFGVQSPGAGRLGIPCQFACDSPAGGDSLR